MIPPFKASFEVADYTPSVEYLEEGGLYSGVFTKAFMYEKIAENGSLNTFVSFSFLTKKEPKMANFNLFIAKNGDFSYIDKNGEKGNYLGFRQLNAIMKLLGVEELDLSEKGNENVFGVQVEVTYLNSLVNKLLVLGFGTEEYLTKDKKVSSKIFLDRVFNAKMQSVKEFENNEEPLSIKSFKIRHKALAPQQNLPKPNAEQSYNPYGIETKENYIEMEDDNDLPF